MSALRITKVVVTTIALIAFINVLAQDKGPAPAGELAQNAPFAGTFYGTFSLNGAPNFAPPVVVSFHAGGTWTGVDAGDFGTLTGAYETVQHGSWSRTGARTIVATGFILRFTPVAGDLIRVSNPRLELTFDDDFGGYEAAAITERQWYCVSMFECPDPFSDAPDEEVDLMGALGIGLSGKRVSP